jgi:tetratricopeptide (TPR) repeat protein
MSKKIYTHLFVFFILLILSFPVSGQSDNSVAKKDSLLKLIAATEGEKKLENYYQYAYLFFKEARDSASVNTAVSVYNDYFREAKKQNNLNDQAIAKSNILGIYHNVNMTNEVFQQAPAVLEMCKKAGNYNLYYYVYQLYILGFLVTDQYSKAISEIQKVYDEAKNLNNTEGILFAINFFATAYNAQTNKKEAMKYMKEGIDFCKKNKYTNQTLVRLYYHYGQELLLESRFDEFLSMYDEFEKALYEHEKKQNSIGKSVLQYFRWVLKGQYYVKIKNNEQAEICCDSLLPYMQTPIVKTAVDQIQVEIYENRGQFREAVDKMDELMLSDTESEMFYTQK